MEPQEIAETIADRRAEFSRSFDEHLAAIETLATETTFNLDVVSSITPNILDGTTVEGREQLRFWEDLYKGLSKAPELTVVTRFSTESPEGCWGMGAKQPSPNVGDAYLRIFENLTQEQLLFLKADDQNPAQVLIDAPSTVISLKEITFEPFPSLLKTNEPLPSFFAVKNLPEHLLQPNVTFGDKDAVRKGVAHIRKNVSDPGADIRLIDQFVDWYKMRDEASL